MVFRYAVPLRSVILLLNSAVMVKTSVNREAQLIPSSAGNSALRKMYGGIRRLAWGKKKKRAEKKGEKKKEEIRIARCAHECSGVKSGDPSWRANCRRNSLVLVERGNPTYNFVRLQEGKLRGGDTYIPTCSTHTHIYTRACAHTHSKQARIRRDIYKRVREGGLHGRYRSVAADDDENDERQ